MDIVIPIKLIISMAKLCIDTLNASKQLHSENKRICNRIRFFLAEVPLWSEYMSVKNDGTSTGTSVYESSRLSGLNILMENVRDTLKDIASTVQALNSDSASWNEKLKRRFAPSDFIAKLLDDERRLNTALDDLGRHAVTHHMFKIVNANFQEVDVSDNIQLAFDDCYDSDQDETEDTTTNTGSGSEVGTLLYSTDSKHSTVFGNNDCQIDFDLLHFTRNFGDRLGIGGFGEVFKGTYAGECVAVKEIDIYRNYQKIRDASVDEFHMECARVCQETSILKHVCIHPNIVHVFGCYIPTTMSIRPVIVMELLDTALDRLLHSNYLQDRALTYINRLQLLQGIISAVEFLHLQGIVHQDIKPSNILVTVHTLVAKLTDFGVADTKKDVGTTIGNYCTTKEYVTGAQQAGPIVAQAGTHAYMSPEKICSSMYNASRKSDIYSLGVTMWEVTSYQKPPIPKTPSEMKQILDNIRNDTSSTAVLLPFPILDTSTLDDTVSSTFNVSMEEKCAYSVLEILAFACLLCDPTCRPNATRLTSYTNDSCLAVVPNDRNTTNLLYNKEEGSVCNPYLPFEIASFKIHDSTGKKKNLSDDISKKNVFTASNHEEMIATSHHSQQQDVSCQSMQLNNDIQLQNSVETIKISSHNTQRFLIIIVVSLILIVTITAVSVMAGLGYFNPPLPPPTIQPMSALPPSMQPMSLPPPMSVQPLAIEPTVIQPAVSPFVKCFSSNMVLYNNVRDYFTSFRSNVQKTYGNISDWCFHYNVTSFEGLFYDNYTKDNLFSNFDEDISQWKTRNITNMTRMFMRSSFNGNLSQWDTSNVRDMASMFQDAISFNQSLSEWNTSSVLDMQYMFSGATSFDNNISSWKTSGVTNLRGMFDGASQFNHDISQWDTSNVQDMSFMFNAAISFNQSLSDWKTSSVLDMQYLFSEASQFDRDISQWDTSKVQNMSFMFDVAISFNQSLSNWNTSSVLDMQYLFSDASQFNRDISQWDTSNIRNMASMFQGAISFNQSLSKWNTSSVLDMQYMFSGASSFDNNISQWKTSAVIAMNSMFSGASSFNHDISLWDTSNVQDMGFMFSVATSFNQNLIEWNTSSVVSMYNMFYLASSFNNDLNQWNTTGVTVMAGMFDGASQFNGDISRWDTSKVEGMSFMFSDAISFNQSLSEWNTSSVFAMEYMFSNASSFNSDIRQWNTSSVTEMTRMFYHASQFNRDISQWNVSQVGYFNCMFYMASSFNQNLCTWSDKIRRDADFGCIIYNDNSSANASTFEYTTCPFKTDAPMYHSENSTWSGQFCHSCGL